MIRAYLAGSVLAVCVLGGCMALCLLALWGYRAMADQWHRAKCIFLDGLAQERIRYRSQQAWRLRASRRYLRKFDETHK